LAASVASASSSVTASGLVSARQRRVDLAVIDVDAEAAAGATRDGSAERRVVAERAARNRRRRSGWLAPLSLAAMRSMARLAPISSTSSSRPRLA